jgi:hypothetical protein
VEAHSRLGHLLVGEGRAREAVPHLEAALRGLADVAARRTPGAAADQLRAALAITPDDPAARRRAPR